MIGYKKPKFTSVEQFTRNVKYWDVDSFAVGFLDTSYLAFYKTNFKDHLTYNKYLQPIQILYFNEKDSLVFFASNCSFPGFPNLNWDYYHSFDAWPPSKPFEDSISVSEHLERNSILLHSIPLNNACSEILKSSVNKEILIIFINSTLKRQCKHLIQLVKEKYQPSYSKILFIMNDNIEYLTQ